MFEGGGIMPKIRRGHDDASSQPEGKVLVSPPPEVPGKFTGSRTVGDYIVLEWDTAYGTIGWAHSLKWFNSAAPQLADAVYGQFWDHMHNVYKALVLPLAMTNLDMAPKLSAIDLYPDCRLSKSYNVTWRQLAAILGTRAPWFPPTLRDLDTISAWKPGDPPAIIPANRLQLPTRALIELAADEPDGSPAAAVCLWLARHIRRQDAEATQQYISEIQAAAADPDNDCAYVHIAAVPAPLLRPEDNEPDEMIRRAGWTQIVERRDVLAAAVAQLVLAWDGGEDWPAGEIVRFHPDSCRAAAEWTARLRPALAGQPPTVLERQLLENIHSIDRSELLYDEASGYPAVRRTDHLGEVTVYACVPQRISTVASLSEVILSDNTVWIRTSDGGLWLAPFLPGVGLSWGYSGGGPAALATLLDRLLDDITSSPVATYNPPPSLESLIEATPQNGTTTYNRAQLLVARAG
jgi:hypothetical protein